MTQDLLKPEKSNSITPLFVICVFLSLTEVILGVGVIQTSGAIQIALTAFVIVFPPVVAAVFFTFLWKRNHVLYAPHEYGIPSDVGSFKKQMTDAKNEMAQTVTEARDVTAEAKDLAARLEELNAELSALKGELDERFERAKIESLSLALAMQ